MKERGKRERKGKGEKERKGKNGSHFSERNCILQQIMNLNENDASSQPQKHILCADPNCIEEALTEGKIKLKSICTFVSSDEKEFTYSYVDCNGTIYYITDYLTSITQNNYPSMKFSLRATFEEIIALCNADKYCDNDSDNDSRDSTC